MAKIEYRDLTDEQLDEIEEKYAVDCTPPLLAEYIFKMWNVTEEEAKELVKKYAELVTMHQNSFIYYVADIILERELHPEKNKK